MEYFTTGGVDMAYEDIYKGLTDEQKQEMLKADIPKFEVIGEAIIALKAGMRVCRTGWIGKEHNEKD